MILIVVWLIVIWGHSMQPAVVSENESGRFLQFISKVIPGIYNNDTGMFIVRKAAHFTEYTLLGVLLCMMYSMYTKGAFRRFCEPALTGLLVAFIDETIQLFVDGRSGEIRDMWIDFGGVSLGVLIVLAFVNNRRYGRR